MTVTVTAVYLLVVFLSPKKGLIFRYFRKKQAGQTIEQEDILKAAIKGEVGQPLNLVTIATKLGFSKPKLKNRLKSLTNSELLNRINSQYFLSDAGTHKANQLVRAHRLWESYLVSEAGMSDDQIHDEAERFEHTLSKEMLDEVDASLGFPELDPHGSPIPKTQTIKLVQAALNRPYIIIVDQSSEIIDAQLWELGILPNLPFKVLRKTTKFVDISMENRRFRLKKELASDIRIR